jgi:hypothetical protein
MSVEHPIFKTRTYQFTNEWHTWKQTQSQCPICKRWFTYCAGYNKFAGVKHHIRKWASKEATAYALDETSVMPHLEFWKHHTEKVELVPQSREWRI